MYSIKASKNISKYKYILMKFQINYSTKENLYYGYKIKGNIKC